MFGRRDLSRQRESTRPPLSVVGTPQHGGLNLGSVTVGGLVTEVHALSS